MFTGLIAACGTVQRLSLTGQGADLTLNVSELAQPLEVGGSLAVNGMCLTATKIDGDLADFHATPETIERTTLPQWKSGRIVNLEPALRLGDALDGHIVQGHVDDTCTLLEISNWADGAMYRYSMPASIASLIAEKGSVALDGISLTVARLLPDSFSVAVIPHTRGSTNLKALEVGMTVNIEADVLARYASRVLQTGSGLTMDRLRDAGF